MRRRAFILSGMSIVLAGCSAPELEPEREPENNPDHPEYQGDDSEYNGSVTGDDAD